MDKITVKIVPHVDDALTKAAQDNSESKTSVVNRAIVVYELLTRLQAKGWTLLLRDSDGSEERIHFL